MVSSTVLSTKLFIPQPRPNLVRRPHLIKRLSPGRGEIFTLVSAPAGFGKTSLVSVWAHQSDNPVIWLTLDENDNDLARLLRHLVAALGQLDPHLGADLLVILDSSQLPPTEALFSKLVNDISGFGHPFSLVLDDYHLITSQLIHDFLKVLLNHIPPQMHLVILSRVDPPVPFSRFRAGGRLVEIRSRDLRFTEAEATTFLNDVMGLELSAQDIRALEKRTEGWIVGLQLAALSLQGREEKHAFVADFSGSHYYIIDYLMEEVLLRQPKNIRSFLCRTAILENLSAELCDAVLESDTSRHILHTLEETNLFLIPLDDQRRWYRYHNLFSDFLRQCLAEDEPDRISELHLRAAHWYEQEGMIPEAVSHALAAKDEHEAARLVEQNALRMLEISELSSLMKLVDMLPEAEVLTHPKLLIYHTWALRLSGRPYDAVEARLNDAVSALNTQALQPQTSKGINGQRGSLSDEETLKLRCHINALHAFQALFREDIPQVMEQALDVQACCPDDRFLSSSTGFALGWGYRFSGNLEAAVRAFSTSSEIAAEAGNSYFAVSTLCRAAYALVLAGKLNQAFRVFQEAVQMATGRDGRRLPVAGYALVYLGGIHYEWDDLEAAQQCLVEGIQKCERVGFFMDQAVGCIYLARVRMALKDWPGAAEAVQKAEQLSERMKGYMYVQRWVDDGQIRLWIAQGDLPRINDWIRTCGLAITDKFGFLRDLEHIILARALVALGRATPDGTHIENALILLRQLLELAESAGWKGKALEIIILQSMAHQIIGEQESALQLLRKALAIAEPEGHMRAFVDEGLPMARLLRSIVMQDESPRFASSLLSTLGQELQDSKDHAEIPLFVTPGELLSKRELEVLRMLATDLTGPEIARELMIALTTLRFHTRNIYSKLNVNSRRAAVRVGSKLDLVK